MTTSGLIAGALAGALAYLAWELCVMVPFRVGLWLWGPRVQRVRFDRPRKKQVTSEDVHRAFG
jgi:hypothetical protein